MPSMTRSLCLAFLLYSLSVVHALPLVIRQDNGAVTVQTVQTTTTPVGPMTQTCVITLTPTTVNGQPEVIEVKNCTLSADSSGTNDGSSGTGSTDSGTTDSGTTDSSSTSTTDSSGGNAAISVDGFQTVAASSDASAATSIASSDASSVSSADSSSATSSATDSSGASASTDTSGTNASSTDTSSSSAQTAADNAPAGAAEAAQVTTTANSEIAAAAVPGKSLNVLPIGLGVFAGISVIALIVVGLVTYERTKYRKAFRQRKLAESGAAMGYGGTAARS